MPQKKVFYRTAFLLLSFLIVLVVRLAYQAVPVASAYGAKILCSGFYLQHRDPQQVIKENLSIFPFSLFNYTLNKRDSSVSGSLWGFAKRKAIYRIGLGATLVNDSSETTIRNQKFIRSAAPVINTDTVPWPNGDLLPDRLPTGINQSALERVLKNALAEYHNGDPVHTKALVVVYNGQLVAEKYADGYDRNTLMPAWSATKSITAALIGILVKKGKLVVEDAAPVSEWRGTDKEKITLKQLLQQTAGLDYEENYRKPGTATTLLFKKGNAAAYAAKLPLLYPPGTMFNYSSGNSNILSRIIRNSVEESSYHTFPYQSLLFKIGMYSTVLEPDASGTYVGSSFCYATARDYARFGLLYYNNGRWNDEQLLPDDWVQATVQPSTANKLERYGYHFWLNGFDETDSSKRWYPDVPEDMYFAAGFGGQCIFIIPSKKLVVVRLGIEAMDENAFLKNVITAIE
ncbi:MAG TPA: serine hydrolase [Agriterribacter sp.]|nr:serine hydrolase [Agriterribacter sp.]